MSLSHPRRNAQDGNEDHPHTSRRASRKLRSACDTCHKAKMRCSGEKPCAACLESGCQCLYSVSNRLGRPKGRKNNRTLEEINNGKNAKAANPCGDIVPPSQRQLFTPSNDGQSGATLDNMVIGIATSDTVNQGMSSLRPSDNFWDFDYGLGLDLGPKEDQSSQNVSPKDPSVTFHQQPSAMAIEQTVHTAAPSTCGACSSITMPSIEACQSSQDGPVYISPTFGDVGSAGLGSTATSRVPSLSLGLDTSIAEIEDLHVIPQSFLSSRSPSARPSTCNCLQQHIKLLYELQDLGHWHTPPSIDIFLNGVRHALALWKSLIQCSRCQHDDGQGVFLLSAMSIRSLLRSLQHLSSNDRYHGCTLGTMSSYQNTPPRVPAAQVTVGNYDATGEEQKLVTGLLILRALWRIEVALEYLQEKFDGSIKPTATKRTEQSESIGKLLAEHNDERYSTLLSEFRLNDDHIERLLRDFESTMQAMRNTLRGTNAATMQNDNGIIKGLGSRDGNH